MGATKTIAEAPAEWVAQWADVIAAAYAATSEEWRNPGENCYRSCAGDVRIVAQAGGYATSRDGRDWAGHGAGDPVVICDGVWMGHRADETIRSAVQALADLPSGMGWRHGTITVTVRGHRKGKPGPVTRSWVIAEVKGWGITYCEPPSE